MNPEIRSFLEKLKKVLDSPEQMGLPIYFVPDLSESDVYPTPDQLLEIANIDPEQGIIITAEEYYDDDIDEEYSEFDISDADLEQVKKTIFIIQNIQLI